MHCDPFDVQSTSPWMAAAIIGATANVVGIGSHGGALAGLGLSAGAAGPAPSPGVSSSCDGSVRVASR